MKLNLGCGPDVRQGYVNCDFRAVDPRIYIVDLSKLPWEWKDNSVDEILMLDFLEHFPYNMTQPILHECNRILKPGGHVDIQVPDFEQCARAVLQLPPYICNNCEKEIVHFDIFQCCHNCGVVASSISEAGIRRLYGGQDYEGNYHLTTFTPGRLEHLLDLHGFEEGKKYLEEDHQKRNWNFKVRAYKRG